MNCNYCRQNTSITFFLISTYECIFVNKPNLPITSINVKITDCQYKFYILTSYLQIFCKDKSVENHGPVLGYIYFMYIILDICLCLCFAAKLVQFLFIYNCCIYLYKYMHKYICMCMYITINRPNGCVELL